MEQKTVKSTRLRQRTNNQAHTHTTNTLRTKKSQPTGVTQNRGVREKRAKASFRFFAPGPGFTPRTLLPTPPPPRCPRQLTDLSTQTPASAQAAFDAPSAPSKLRSDGVFLFPPGRRLSLFFASPRREPRIFTYISYCTHTCICVPSRIGTRHQPTSV